MFNIFCINTSSNDIFLNSIQAIKGYIETKCLYAIIIYLNTSKIFKHLPVIFNRIPKHITR